MKFLKNYLTIFLSKDLPWKLNCTAKIAARGKTTVTPRRAILYVPGHDKRKIQKISTLNVDCAVLDLEDGVAVNKKDEARNFLNQISYDFEFGLSEHAVRINSVQSGLAEKDISSIFSSKRLPSTILIPKVDNLEHVEFSMDRLMTYSKKQLPEEMSLIFYVESSQSLLNLKDICERTIELCSGGPFSLEGLVFGSDDFCADIGATRTTNALELLTARQMLVIIAKSFRLQAIDMVHIDYKDEDGLKAHSAQGAAMGFTGKQVIHPNQIKIVQDAFSPSKEKIEWATELIKLFKEHQTQGKGAFTFRGSMIDKPSLLQAEYIVKLAAILSNRK